MGETIDQTRVEIAAQRADLEATANGLRDALDLGKRVREHPGVVIGVGAAAAFLVAGGPRRLARILRRRMSPTAAEQAYDALPASMQAWVSTLAGEAGPKASEVRNQLVEELRRWRRDPIKDRKARKELARQMVDGPPGPARTAWTAAETAMGLVAAALARRAIERFLTGEPPPKVSSTVAGPGGGGKTVAGPGPDDYAGWSSRD
ncbi:MAG: hypothetical protein M3R32_04895 [Chloroflexota bacterium]|nr:hypothetical protein [Chloroflexota bacterium]